MARVAEAGELGMEGIGKVTDTDPEMMLVPSSLEVEPREGREMAADVTLWPWDGGTVLLLSARSVSMNATWSSCVRNVKRYDSILPLHLNITMTWCSPPSELVVVLSVCASGKRQNSRPRM